MNQFYNPIFISKVLKSYLFDIDRLKKINENQLKIFQDKQFRKMVAFTFTVPMYHDIYVKAGIHPRDITGIKDITKLPMISKEEIKHYYPQGIISTKIPKNRLIEVSTSGTTGKKLSIYVDPFDIVMGLFGYLRTLREYGISWRNDRISIIGDFAPHTAESGYIHRGIMSQGRLRGLFHNIQWLNTNDDPEKVIKELNNFHPDFIGGYAGMLGHLAVFKEKGLGQDVSPHVIASTGSVLDPSLKTFIEKSFGAHVFEAYGATESGPLAFQCHEGSFHVMSDLVFLEFFRENKPVVSGEAGKLVVTKLYGRGTPFIRYTAVNDIVAPRLEKCSCDIVGELIQKVYGRDDLALFFSGGRVLLASSISNIYSRLLYELKTNKVKETKVIQSSMTKIDVQVVIDQHLKKEDPSVDQICVFLQRCFQEKIGSGVDIVVREVSEIDKTGPRIISNVDASNFEIQEYM